MLLILLLNLFTFQTHAHATTVNVDGATFCQNYGTHFPAVCANPPPTKHPWKVRFYFGNANTFYSPTNMRIKTSRLDITANQVNGVQRSGYHYFRFWERGLQNAMQWVDEPTNNLKIVFDKHNHQFFLSVNHPKVVYVNNYANPGLNQNVHVNGTVDGVALDAYVPLSPVFDGYNTQPGELNITNFENSYMFMQYEVGYGYALPVIRSNRLGSIVVTPQVQGGVYVGRAHASIMKPGAYWDADKYESNRDKVMGKSVTGALRLEWRGPHERVGVFGEFRESYGFMKHDFLDGSAKYDLRYRSITIGINVNLNLGLKKHKKPRPNYSP